MRRTPAGRAAKPPRSARNRSVHKAVAFATGLWPDHTNPTIASAGLTEAQALAQGIDCESRVLDLANVPRAIVSRNTRGVVKLVAERDTGRVIGLHMLADGAGDAILAGVYAIDANLTVSDLAASWNPYLTIGEGIHLAAQAFTRDVSKLSCCAA